jgi:hypothetical protein
MPTQYGLYAACALAGVACAANAGVLLAVKEDMHEKQCQFYDMLMLQQSQFEKEALSVSQRFRDINMLRDKDLEILETKKQQVEDDLKHMDARLTDIASRCSAAHDENAKDLQRMKKAFHKVLQLLPTFVLRAENALSDYESRITRKTVKRIAKARAENVDELRKMKKILTRKMNETLTRKMNETLTQFAHVVNHTTSQCALRQMKEYLSACESSHTRKVNESIAAVRAEMLQHSAASKDEASYVGDLAVRRVGLLEDRLDSELSRREELRREELRKWVEKACNDVVDRRIREFKASITDGILERLDQSGPIQAGDVSDNGDSKSDNDESQSDNDESKSDNDESNYDFDRGVESIASAILRPVQKSRAKVGSNMTGNSM